MSIQNIIHKRRTLKVLSAEPKPILKTEVSITDLEEMVTCAGKAPFHYPANNEAIEHTELKSLAPWRFYILDTKTCRDLAKYYIDNNIDGGKIVQMLHTASALIQATWIPEPLDNGKIEFHQKNIEHVAATSAAIQNLLLVATEKGYETYWSSGGTLRENNFKELLNIPTNEQLLGSIFIFSDDNIKNTKQITGAWREKQGSIKDFSSFVTI
ncbi:hypothetical protein AXE80_09465 [Wenyingzhuangia fucanilytica]|uniref:Nitroreductase domain-containing protein n=1 Tax=Wenyingzhuangia fucanilytica TaxID=1790137 RepID=A0A1B1Y6X3_9FLAO|nr:nitroreductase family protein [Wenyingzhuangia fucanilytica]ANW96494.1 hypothetical protein AXE80_09465 [Wenyingzhuangia fucanilytica]